MLCLDLCFSSFEESADHRDKNQSCHRPYDTLLPPCMQNIIKFGSPCESVQQGTQVLVVSGLFSGGPENKNADLVTCWK